ncbi:MULTISPECIES: Crp/Fnr family transcriptional regulator [Chryseobacterium]|jgi:CRP-like cAMP-binding protein|uniref:CRP-like cAMP-binding protein n=1 Tax=Chryseobacterium geocarposphaerae TaxID=1416776 RepID=A0ABU1LFL6_9FLAO|nr:MULTISPECIES: Crp/Fnr family transcriptional regulator [Chryseobacterium]MDR6405511.1 CRP-like cAMP-binding protein [Chryseobacterium geocarposphaerae]MDR6698742.1 CRP-like cAMP-binding protein [Chryseobacterium ginsenosidimutans]
MKTISCMNINPELLYIYGGEDRSYNSKDYVYREGDPALYYYQIVKGRVKQNSYNEEGKEFIHNILGENQSFGEPMLFLEEHYIMNTVCLTSVELIRLSKNNFMELLEKNPKLCQEMNACFSQRIYFKEIMLQSMSSQNPILRLKGLLNYLKSYYAEDCEQCFHVEFTRQQIANLTGLRVETVIRALKKMEKQGELKIDNRKILY